MVRGEGGWGGFELPAAELLKSFFVNLILALRKRNIILLLRVGLAGIRTTTSIKQMQLMNAVQDSS